MPDDVEFRDHSDAAKQALRDGIISGVEDIVDKLLSRARDKVPVDTGNLMRSIQKGELQIKKASVKQTFGAFAPYAASIEYGSEAHEIRARKKDYLSFVWYDAPPDIQEQYGEANPRVFFKSVDHPGTDPQPFMRPAIRETLATDAGKLMVRQISKSLRQALPKPASEG